MHRAGEFTREHVESIKLKEKIKIITYSTMFRHHPPTHSYIPSNKFKIPHTTYVLSRAHTNTYTHTYTYTHGACTRTHEHTHLCAHIHTDNLLKGVPPVATVSPGPEQVAVVLCLL